jgi:hypothetical protein
MASSNLPECGVSKHREGGKLNLDCAFARAKTSEQKTLSIRCCFFNDNLSSQTTFRTGLHRMIVMGLRRGVQGADLRRYMRPVITMKSLKPNRSEGEFLSAALLGLGLIVFLWGFGYKLSLYFPLSATSHSLLRAKAIPEQQRPSEAEDGMQRPSFMHPRRAFMVSSAAAVACRTDCSGRVAKACITFLPSRTRSVLRRLEMNPLPIFRPPPASA